jgi:glutamate---cysteine ligase / carboxylate-amine ligase
VSVNELRYGVEPPFALGVEEELLLVDPRTLALAPRASEVLAALDVPAGAGVVMPDLYEALIELASPVVRSAAEGVEAVGALRDRVRAVGPRLLGAGIHPDGAFGDAAHVPTERYRRIDDQLRGLAQRTPTCALHVHVGMPDAETAIRVYNALREWLPVLQALAANSPFWHGRDSGLASARAQLYRAYPRADIPDAFRDHDEYEATVAALLQAGDLPEYTYLWWDLRPHPRLGTVELRAMDSQSPLWSVGGLAALVHGLAVAAAQAPPLAAPSPREVLMESSFRAARDGLDATLWHEGALRPARAIAEEAIALAAPHTDEALEGAKRILREGNGADRQRAAYARGGMRALLELLSAEAALPYA